MESATANLRLMRTLSRTGSGLSAFLAWWRAELFGMLPETWRQNLRAHSSELHIELEPAWQTGKQPGAATMVALRDGKCLARESCAVEPSGEGLASTLREFAQRQGVPGDHLTVSLPAHGTIVKRLNLPRATERNLQKVLAFEMDRHTPFCAEDVYFAYRVVERDATAGTLQVEMVVLPRAAVAPLLNSLGRDGISVGGLVVRCGVLGGRAAGISGNMLPGDEAGTDLAVSGPWRVRLAWCALLLAGSLAAAPLLQKRLELNELEVRLAQVRAEAELAIQAREALLQLANPSKEFLAKRNAAPLAIAVLDELSRVIPDDTWLDRYDLNASVLTIQGESQQAAALLSLIEASDLFEGAHFSSTITRNARTGKDRFVIQAEVLGGSGR